jgi:hypothetical protein
MGTMGMRTDSKNEISNGLFFSLEKNNLKTISFLGSKIFCTDKSLIKVRSIMDMQAVEKVGKRNVRFDESLTCGEVEK